MSQLLKRLIKTALNTHPIKQCTYCNQIPKPLRSKKPKSTKTPIQNFIDLKECRAIGGHGGDGCTSFLSLWSNEYAGPDGGDGGNGGHVVFQANTDTKDLHQIPTILRAEDGESGRNKDRHGKNAPHNVIAVPIGTIIKNSEGKVIGDLADNTKMFLAARGGAGGKGNHFFISDTNQAPDICEYGAQGEDLKYTLEIKSIAHVGLIGFPNAGKSTLLRALTRARPKVAPYPFTTLKPHIGMVLFDDYEQIAIADLPGLIPDSHKNRGLGIEFLKHAERCSALLFVIDISLNEPESYLESLKYELGEFSEALVQRPQLIIANKIDLPGAEDNLKRLANETQVKIIPISAKVGTNLDELLREIRILYDLNRKEESNDDGDL